MTKHGLAMVLAVLAACLVGRAQIEIEVDEPQMDPTPGVGPGIKVPEPRGDSGGPARGGPVGDCVEFANKDKLHGQLLAIDPATFGVRWKHESAERPIDFSPGGLAVIQLGERKAPPPAGENAAVVLSNDDLLRGKIVSMNADALTLDTGYAGKVAVKRAMLKKLRMGVKSASVLYEGPHELSEWTLSRNYGKQVSWKFKEGALYAIREVPLAKTIAALPDMVEYQFDVAWRGFPGFTFTFFNDSMQQQQNGYSLQVSGGSIHMYRYDRNMGSQHLGNIEYQRFSSGQVRGATFTVLADRAKKTFVLLIDGQMVRQWTDPAAAAMTGKVMLFQPQQQSGIKLSNIRVSEWDGKIPQAGGAGDVEVKEDLIRFVNGDKVSGKLKTIGGVSVQFETSYAPMEIPMERISEITMGTSSLERARRNKEDVRAVFAGQGVVTLKLVKFEKGSLTGWSENFGDIILPVEAFRRLEFNIYAEKPAKDDDDIAF